MDDNPQQGEDEEPSLGFLDHMTNQERIVQGLSGDREDEHDGSEPTEDKEPSLGSLDAVTNQDRSWECKPEQWFDREGT